MTLSLTPNLLYSKDNLEDEENDCQSPRSVLNAIAEDIRPMVPFNSILASENINVPVCGPVSKNYKLIIFH